MKYQEFKELLDNNSLTERSDLKLNEFDTHLYYVDKDQHLLLFLPSCPQDIQVFNTVRDFEELKKKLTRNITTAHILTPYQSKIENINVSLKQEINDLSAFLNINADKLNCSLNSIKLIDKIIRKLKISRDIYLEKLYFPILNYMGETLIHELGGEWYIITRPDNIIEPYIITSEGKLVNIFLPLYKDATDHFDTLSHFIILDFFFKSRLHSTFKIN